MPHRLLVLLLLFIGACGDDPARVEGARIVVEGAERDASGFWLVDFGAVAIGTREERSLILRNEGGKAARLELPPLLPPFSASWTREGIEPGGATHLQLAFAPATPGTREALVGIQAGEGAIDLRLRGVGFSERKDCLEVEPASVDLGTVDLGCSAPRRSLRLHNRCTHPVEARVSLGEGASSVGFYGPSNLTATIAPGEAVVEEVGFVPQAPGTFEASVVAVTADQRVSVPVTGRAHAPGRREVSDRFGAWARPVDLLLVIDESAETAAYTAERRALAEHLEDLARWGLYDLRIGVTGSTLDPGPGCGGSGGQLLPRGAPEVLEDVSWYPEGLADRVEALLSPSTCDAPARPIEAALQAAETFVREDDNVWLSMLLISAQEDVGEREVESLVEEFRRLARLNFAAVAGPAPACGQEEEAERLALFADLQYGGMSPICEPWKRAMTFTLPLWLPRSSKPGFSMPRTYYLSDLPADRNDDGVVDERDATVFIEEVEVPRQLEDGSPAWLLNADFPEITFNHFARPRDIESVRVEYEVDNEPVCDGR